MDFKRSFWGYSPAQVEQLITERNMAFEQKKSQLENELESIHQSSRKLNQILSQLRNKYELAYKQQQIIESSRPILEQLLQKLQEYIVSEAQNSSRENAAIMAEISVKSAQIEADQAKLTRFWQNLHNKLGDLLSAMELEESAGKSLMDKYSVDLDVPPVENTPIIQASSPEYPVHDDLLTDTGTDPESLLFQNHDSKFQHPADQTKFSEEEAVQDKSMAEDDEPALANESEPAEIVQAEVPDQLPDAELQTISARDVQAEDPYQSLTADKVWSITPRGDQPGMALLAGDLNEKPEANKSLSIISQDDQPEVNFQAVEKQADTETWKAVLPDFSTALETHEEPEQDSMLASQNNQVVNPDAPLVFNPFNTITPDASLVFEPSKTSQVQSAAVLDDADQPQAPAGQAAPNVENINRREAEPQQPAPSALSKQHALVLDHDATILAMLRIILQRDGFTITECMDGYQASQNMDYIDPPMLAILEANAPIVNGLQLIRKIRSKPGWEDCVIIVLTENTTEQGINELLAAGANDYINKPVNTRELVNRMRRLTGISVVAL